MARLLRKLCGVLPLLTLAVTGATLWITRIWWILPLGGLAALIMAIQSLLSEREEAQDQDTDFSYDLTPLDAELRTRFSSILDERKRILEELKERSTGSFLSSDEISSRVNELVGGYYDLLLKLEKIRPFIDQPSTTALEKSIEDLKIQVDRSSDEVTRENLSLALKNKTDQMRSLQELARYEERVNSQLETLVSALNSLYVRIVQIKISPDSSLDPTSEIKESINKMLMDVEISEKVTQEYHRILAENAL